MPIQDRGRTFAPVSTRYGDYEPARALRWRHTGPSPVLSELGQYSFGKVQRALHCPVLSTGRGVLGFTLSKAVRKWYDHDHAKWPEFRQHYFAELDAMSETVKELLTRLGSSTATFLFSSRDE